jgi:hypothetical protein
VPRLIIFAGTILPTIWTQDVMKRNRLILALYTGVVIAKDKRFDNIYIWKNLKDGGVRTAQE